MLDFVAIFLKFDLGYFTEFICSAHNRTGFLGV